MQTAYSASKIFTGQEFLEASAVLVNNGEVEKIILLAELPQDIPHQHFSKAWLVPAFVDAQVYGAAHKLLAAYPFADTLQIMCDKFMKEGTCLFQPTVATNTPEVFKKCIDAVREYWRGGGKGIIGLHLEGPWIHVEKRGAHVKEWIHAPRPEEVEELLAYGQGVISMITLAPEVCTNEIISQIRSYNIVVSAGHSKATCAEAIKAFENGITAVTHLYNAMSSLHHREPGLVGATLLHPSVMASIIPDGNHVDYAAIIIAKKIMGNRLFAITDAVTETTTGPYQHQRAGNKYECNKVLSGSALSMHQAFYNLVHHVNIEAAEAHRMCSLYPAQTLGCPHRYGKIAPAYAAQFVVLDAELKLLNVING